MGICDLFQKQMADAGFEYDDAGGHKPNGVPTILLRQAGKKDRRQESSPLSREGQGEDLRAREIMETKEASMFEGCNEPWNCNTGATATKQAIVVS